MPIPKNIARFNRSVTNRVTRAIAGWAPGFAIVHHKGRKSGMDYRTPVNAFRHGDTLVIALTYGPDGDWTRNVLAASGCEAECGRKTLVLGEPRLVHDSTRRRVPLLVRPVLRLLNVADFLELAILPPATMTPHPTNV